MFSMLSPIVAMASYTSLNISASYGLGFKTIQQMWQSALGVHSHILGRVEGQLAILLDIMLAGRALISLLLLVLCYVQAPVHFVGSLVGNIRPANKY